jgi:hypothetical protein
VADPLEVGDLRGQSGPDQAAALDTDRERGLVALVAMGAPPGMPAMLLDQQRHVPDIDLLDHPRRDRDHGPQGMPARRGGRGDGPARGR